jgi:hypothetical protein
MGISGSEMFFRFPKHLKVRFPSDDNFKDDEKKLLREQDVLFSHQGLEIS